MSSRSAAVDAINEARRAAAEGDRDSTMATLLGALVYAVLDVADAVREHARRK